MRREAEARKGVEEARLAVIRACGELRESEMFLSAVMADERSAVGGAAARAASSADAANTMSRTFASLRGAALLRSISHERGSRRASHKPQIGRRRTWTVELATGYGRLRSVK